MTSATSNLRGIAAMLFATASFVACDSFMKLVTEALPPFEVLFLRGIAATICCGTLVLALGHGRLVGRCFNKGALLRAFFETANPASRIDCLTQGCARRREACLPGQVAARADYARVPASCA